MTNKTDILKISQERKANLKWLALELLNEWGLTLRGWTFQWNNRKRSFGICYFREKTIELSLFLLSTIDDEEAEDTIRHEIAHALDFEDRGTSDHSWKWKAWAVKVGARPERCGKKTQKEAKEALAYKSKYRLQCPNGHVVPSHKKKKRSASCVACGKGYYDPSLKLEQILNHPSNIPIEYGGWVENKKVA